MEQSNIINVKLSKSNTIVLNGDNNKQSTQQAIVTGDYTHVFISPKIALSKKFKKNILNQNIFINWFCLLAVDEIQLVEEWGNQFRLFYAEIEKISKRIPIDISLMGISATMTLNI